MLKILLLSGLILGSSNSFADTSLTDYLKSEIGTMQDAVSATPSGEPLADDEGWWFRRFWLRVRPKIGFTAAGAVKVEITPEVELLWERPYPDGWTTYKPVNIR
ncbi:MAG TPA: hypothetical protein VM598_12760 [Bdellovibrionota bacterium]|nr:hypothetical protein [Bdellovibrionota bacterium]